MKKITFLVMAMFAFSFSASAQCAPGESAVSITTSGGNYTSEKWVNITTEIDNGGTQVWGQGDGTYGNGAGLLTDEIVCLAPGTYYVNCFDNYADGWDGTLINVSSYGALLGDNGGVSPDDGTDTDATGGQFDDAVAELEASFVIVVAAPPACVPPVGVTIAPSFESADFSWSTGGTETEWEYAVLLASDPAPTAGTSTTAMTHTEAGLTASTDYIFYLRAVCDATTFSDFLVVPFSTVAIGATCEAAIEVGALPYNTSDDTANFDDDYDGSAGDASCGTTSSYLNGDDVVYQYTATSDAVINIALSAIGDTYSGMFVYTDCADIGTACVAGFGNGNSSDDYSLDVPVTTGTTYYILISTWASPQSTTYTLDISEVACALPADLAVNVTAPTEAVISWVDNNTPAATAWEYVVQEPGTGEPTAAGDAATSNSVTVTTGLVEGMSYEFYVRTDCGGTYSGWAGPFEWAQVLPPANDACIDAIALTVNADLGCTETTSGTIHAATASGEDEAACSGTENDDVWFSFVATAESHTISLLNPVGSTTDLYHSVWSGTCGALTNLSCSDPNNSTVAGLTVGDTYLLRVYSWTANAGQTTSFDVCIGTLPPPPANDECADAIAVSVNPDFENGMTTAGTIAAATASGEDETACGGTENDDVWFSFVATQESHTIDLLNPTGSTTDLYHSVWSGDCGALTNISCSDPNNSTLTDLTIGDTYLIRVYSWTSTAGQTTTFEVSVGTDPALSIGDVDNQAAFTYYPNPVKNTLTLNAQNTIEQVSMYNMLGQEVLRVTPNTVDSSLDMSNLQTGTYFVKVTIANVTETIRVIKQ